jgi:hypothetical protein
MVNLANMINQRLQVKMVESANGKTAFEIFAAAISVVR